MIAAPETGRLIAFCGIDGAGKSSLVARLDEENVIPGASFLHKVRKTSLNLVSKYGVRDEAGKQNWARGPFAENAAAASTIDFLHHYDTVIAPRLAAGEWLVCDRYALCYDAYNLGVGTDFRLPEVFKQLRRPDWLVFVDAPVEVVLERIAARGGPSDDEQPAAIRCQREGYFSLLAEQNDVPTLILENAGDFEQAYVTLRRHVENVISSWM